MGPHPQFARGTGIVRLRLGERLAFEIEAPDAWRSAVSRP